MNSKNFRCPYCNYKHNPLFVFKIKHVDTVLECTQCNEELKPKFNKKIKKYWKFGFLIGIFFSIVPAQIYLMYDRNLPLALLTGLFSGLFVLGISVYFVVKTTYFEKIK